MELYYVIGAIWATIMTVLSVKRNPFAVPLLHGSLWVFYFILWPLTLLFKIWVWLIHREDRL